MISLKTYAGRMHQKRMLDMPFHHDQDLTPKQYPLVEEYCFNDLEVTKSLFLQLSESIAIREHMSKEYSLDLRSKSDAQIAEAILKAETGVYGSTIMIPDWVVYDLPKIIKTKSPILLDLINGLVNENFEINQANGSPIEPQWLKDPIIFRDGIYKIGLGGLHSQHDVSVSYIANDEWMISDIDAASYYPSIILKCGIIPHLPGGKGRAFINTYERIYLERLAAKHNNPQLSKTLKIVLNGLFGKLGSTYCPFYSPDLLLAVTLTGQLNLLTLIDDLAKHRGIEIISANTDGIMVRYKASLRTKMLNIVTKHGKHTGFDYEETRYRRVALKDVNNYIAITTDGKIKAKGLYARSGILEMKNPTMEICSKAAANYLCERVLPEATILTATDIRDFVAVRSVKTKGGGVQHTHTKMVDDWIEIERGKWMRGDESGKIVKRVSRPAPIEVGYGGVPFGRVARWYMTTEQLPAITQVNNGNQVPKTEGAKLCMTLPDQLPDDLDKNWYIEETYEMLRDMGVKV
jgi:DNA polymerase elongation subunit (family B)